MAEETATAAPARTRTRSATKSTTPAKATRSRAKANPVEQATEAGREVYVFDLVPAGETKTYAKFTPPEGSACVGTFYAPLGTQAVKVKLTGGPAA